MPSHPDAVVLTMIAGIPLATIFLSLRRDYYFDRSRRISYATNGDLESSVASVEDDVESARFASIFSHATYVSIIASSVFGYAAGVGSKAIDPLPLVGYFLIVIAGLSILVRILALWRDRPSRDFEVFYAKPLIATLYPDREVIKFLYSRKNWIPLWGWPNSRWRQRVRYPNGVEMQTAIGKWSEHPGRRPPRWLL